MDHLDLDLNDPETMAFDEAPDEFVLLETSPIVFTMRGLKHLGPRFKSVGFDIAAIRTPDEFRHAYNVWTELEVALLAEKIAAKANASHQANEHKVLLAAIQGDFDLATKEAKRLAHKNRANLTLRCPD